MILKAVFNLENVFSVEKKIDKCQNIIVFQTCVMFLDCDVEPFDTKKEKCNTSC